MSNRLAHSTVRTGAILAARVLTQAISLILLTRLFGPQSYGPLVAASALAIVLGTLASLGAGYVMLLTGPKQPSAVAEAWRYGYPLTLALGLTLFCLYVPGATLIGGENALPLQILFCIAITELLISPCTALLGATLQAHDRVALNQVLQWLPLALRATAIVPCYWLSDENRMVGYVLLQMAAATIGLGLAAVITSRTIRLKWRPRLATADELRVGASYSAMHMVAINSAELDKILAARFLSPHDTGVYAATTRVIGAIVTPIVAALLSAQPRLFSYPHTPSREGLKLIKLLGALSLGWGVLSALLLFTIAPLLHKLFGASFSEMADLLPLLALSALPLAMRYTGGTILAALGKPFERIFFEVAGALILITLIAVLTLEFGIRGFASATIFSEASMAIFSWLLVYRRIRLLGLPSKLGS